MTIANLDKLELSFNDVESVKVACAVFRDVFNALRAEIGKVIVGQDEIVEQALIALFADGHTLLEGVPGLGKTLLVSTLSKTLSLPGSRIQFTPDVMPADITGTQIVVDDEVTGHRKFSFQPGPIFAQLVLADEINRATPKSQAALLEAMQERAVTVGGHTHALDQPFFVMATQNPIEQEGTYALPEAQLDRFLLKINVPYANQVEMHEILTRTTRDAAANAAQILDGHHIQRAQRLAEHIVIAPHVQDFAIRLVLATHPGSEQSDAETNRYIAVGVSPRGAQALVKAGKVKALMDGRYAVSFRDLEYVAFPALRHRIKPSFEASADNITSDDIIDRLLHRVPREVEEGDDGNDPAPSALKTSPGGAPGS